MGAPQAGRVAVMSIRPEFADRILDGSKRVEFRKRRLAPDITTVLIYATMPVGRVIGAFEVGGYDIGAPTAVWERHKKHAGISRAGYRRYFSGDTTAVGILVKDARRLANPLALTELDEALRVPQSFVYLALNPGVPRNDGQARLHRELAYTH